MDSYENVIFFDRYQVERTLCENAVFTSFIGRDLTTNADVLIRLVNPSVITKYEIDKICFSKDISVIRHFDSPNILKMLESDNYANTACSIYEYNKYYFLSDYLEKYGKLDVTTSLKLISQIANAIRYSHSQHILHRNISPDTVIIHIDDSGNPIAKLFDFGMSYLVDYSTATGKQIDNHFGYMAPESAGLLDRKIDERSDLYSLGILFYQFVTGTIPFHADTIDSMVYLHVAVSPKAPSEFVHNLSPEVNKMICRLISKDPDLRYQTANEVINDIDRLLSGSMPDGSISIKSDDILQTIDADSKVLCRRNELDDIRAHYTSALEQKGSFFLLRGPRNCGKSDLFTNLCSELVTAGIPFFRAHFSQQGSLVPYFGFQEILNGFMDLFANYDRKLQITESKRLAKTLSNDTDTVISFYPAMKNILPQSVELPKLDSFKDQQRTLILLSSFFLSLYTQEKPFIYIFDDIHYADSASLALLEEIAHQVSRYKVFVICSYSDNISSDTSYLNKHLYSLIDRGFSNFIDLNPYNENRLADFFSELLSLNHDDSQALTTYLLPKTEGNPYYCVNILKSMIEDEVISIRDGRLEQNWQQLRALNTTNDMTSIISRRISRLDEDTITLLEIASSIGSEFSIKILRTITDLDKRTLTAMLDKALDLQLIAYSSARDIMIFAHSDIHTAFIERIEKPRLTELHLWIAKAIEQTIDAAPGDIFALCFHLEAAHRSGELRKFIMQAARQAHSANAIDSAINYYLRALNLLDTQAGTGNAEWKECKRSLAELYLTSGHFDEAIAVANDLLPVLRNNVQIAKLLQYIGLGYFRQSRYRACEEILIRALDYVGVKFPKTDFEFKSKGMILKVNRTITSKLDENQSINQLSDDDLEKARVIVSIYEIMCWIYAYSDMDKFDYVCLHMYKYAYKSFGTSRELSIACSALSLYYMLHNNDELSENFQQLSVKMRRSGNDSYGIARSMLFTGISKLCQGQIDKSIKMFLEATSSFAEVGDLWELNNTNSFLVVAYLLMGDYEKCEKLCLETIDLSKKLSDSMALCQSYCTLIRCYTHLGNYPKASEISTRCETIVNNLRFPYETTLFNLTYGELLIEEEKYREAIKYLDAARIYYEGNNFVKEFTASLYGYLCIAKIKLLDSERGDLALNEIQNHELDIGDICNKAMEQTANRPNLIFPAYRANALYSIMTERENKADMLYKKGTQLASDSQIRYEAARLNYEYGCYLVAQHRNHEARYYTFEAYMTFSSLSSSVYLKLCEDIIAEKYHEDFKENSLIANVTARRNRMNVDRKVNTLLRLGGILTSTLELDELQKRILQDAVELVGAERGILFLYPESGEKRLYVASVFNLGNFDCNTYDWMLDEVEKHKKPIIINDVQSDEYRKHYTAMVRYGIKSAMAMPMFVRGNLFGVIYLDSRLVRQIFNDDYLETMEFIANQGGAPIENARLYHKAISDGLTGIYGRSYLDNLIIDKTSEENVALSAIMIDVDHFKKFNDTYGHPFGDKVLKMIANIMKRVSGEHGTPCRYGGEEFVIILDTNEESLALETAEKLRQTVESSTIAFNDGVNVSMVSVTISLGVSIWNASMERVDLIEHADKALYYAKQHGRNQTMLWNEEL